MEKRLLVLRHPETEANVTGRWVGRGNSEYTDVGRVQAALLVREAVEFAPDELWSSPLPRCFDVAKEAAGHLELMPRIDERLVELDFGLAEGLTLEEAQERGIRFDFKSEDDPVAPEGESRRDILARTSAAVDEMLSGDAVRVAMITHGGVFRSTVPHLLGLPIASIWSLHIPNAAFLEYRIIDGYAQVVRFGQVG